MAAYIYDIEVFPNMFSATFINVNAKGIDNYIGADILGDASKKKASLEVVNPKIFIVYDNLKSVNADINQSSQLVSFLKAKSTQTLIGFNNKRYDDIILDYIIYHNLDNYNPKEFTKRLKAQNDKIINYIGNVRKDFNIPYSNKYFSIDLMSLNRLDKLKISLKQVSISLKWYRVEDLTFPEISIEDANDYYNGFTNINSFDRFVFDDVFSKVIDYNINDVLITKKLYEYSNSELKNRLAISKKYNINLLSASRSTVGDRLMSMFYASATGLSYWDFKNLKTYRNTIKFNDIIDNTIQFKTDTFKNLLTYLKSIKFKVGRDILNEVIFYKGTKYKLAAGGLHSDDYAHSFNNDKYHIIDVDVGSFYPNIMINRKIKPKHLSNIFISLLESLTKTRLLAKHNGDKDTADILKIVINSVYGKLGYEYGWLYDLQALYSVTINGQLYLLNLIERLELADIHVISANTDGIVSLIPDEKLELYKNICNEWKDDFNFTVDYTEYKKYVRLNVNSYITLKIDGKTKTKNDFVTDIKIDKGYNAPIIAKTLYEYYINGKSIEETIKTGHIYDYCISIKVGSQFKTEYHYIDNGTPKVKVLQKNNRYFVSNRGGVILKHSEHKYINVIKGYNVTIFNTFYYVDDYDINYNYYMKKVYEIVNKISGLDTKYSKKHSGSLFDNI